MKTLDQIAAELQGYDPQALSASGVLAFLAQQVQPVEATQDLPLFEALGRVLAQDVMAPFDVPPHDNSAMDGYAFAGQEMAPTLVASRTALPPEGAAAPAAWQSSSAALA